MPVFSFCLLEGPLLPSSKQCLSVLAKEQVNIDMEAKENVISDWNECENYHLPELALRLTDRTVKILSSLKDGNEVECFLDQISKSKCIDKLVDLLQVTPNGQTLTNVLTILNILTSFRNPGTEFSKKAKKSVLCSNLSRTALWPVLMEKILESSTGVPNELRYAMLDLLISYFKNKTNSLKACQTVGSSDRLVPDALNLLEAKTNGSRKMTQRRRKTAAAVLSSISRHKEGQQLILKANGLERLYAYVLSTPDEKSFDTVIHKIGQTILRCVQLRDLPNEQGSKYSAFVYEPLRPVLTGANGSGVSSDSSGGESDSDEDEDEQEARPPLNSSRNIEELKQYGRHFDDDHEDELTEMCRSVPADWDRSRIYEFCSRRTRSIHGFRLIPYPDWINASSSLTEEKFFFKDRAVCRSKLIKTLEYALNPDSYRPKLVYDLDSMLLDPEETRTVRMIDVESLAKPEEQDLCFESRFECGNLRKAFKVGFREYDLILNADVNSASRQQWFYFRLSGSGIRSSATYTFNIVNMEKQRTLFNEGMQPVIFSVRRCLETGQANWERSGSAICYYRNVFRRAPDQSYWSLSFDLTFPYDNDVYYVAYHYPLTYSQLMTDLVTWRREWPDKSRLRLSTLCRSPCQNIVPLLSIGSHDDLSARRISFISARVHPVESCSSFCMRGLINAAAAAASENCHQLLFVLVPMLNVDGVIHGCSRSEVGNEDLNRRWLQPHPFRHPSIYHYKGLLEFICRVVRTNPVALIDLHGHSRRFNVFLYGCDASQSWIKGERFTSTNVDTQLLVRLLLRDLPSLDTEQCSWQVEKSRESCLRIVSFRHFSPHSFTLECSLGGSNQRPLQGLVHFNTASYLQVGYALHRAIGQMP